MHLTEREYRATQPLHPKADETSPGYGKPPTTPIAIARPAPRTVLQALAILTRADVTLTLLMPVLVGALLGWWETGQFNWLNLGLALLGMMMTGWGFAALSDYADFRYSQRPGARPVSDPLATGFGLMLHGIVSPQTVRDVARIAFAIGALCSLWLALLAGWPVLVFSGFSLLAIWAVILLPPRYGYRGWGLGELGTLLGLGLLPTLASYYVQTQAISWLPVWAGGAFGLFTTLLFFNYNAINYRRDWLIHKRTLTVNLGLARAIDLSALLMVLAYISLLLMVTLTQLPLLALLALGALPVGLGVFARLDRNYLTPDASLHLYHTSAQAAVLTGVLFGLALLIDRMI